MKTTRQKRPDRVICKEVRITWKDFLLILSDNGVFISNKVKNQYITFPLSEIPNLIKALEEINKS